VMHTDKVLRLSLDLPLIIEIVETEETIQSILPDLDEMIGGGLVTLERARVILYRAEGGRGREKTVEGEDLYRPLPPSTVQLSAYAPTSSAPVVATSPGRPTAVPTNSAA